MTTFSLAVPHTPWVPARVESVKRLAPVLDERHRIFTERAPNWQWSRTVWRWMADQAADYAVQLQDDVIPAPHFWSTLEAMCAATNAPAIGLHAGHPAGPSLAAQGARWYRTRSWVVGVGYVLRGDIACALADYRDAHEDEAKQHNEDDFIGRFLAARGIDVWHPIPSIIDHDVSVPSTYGNDAHTLRRPSVLWHEYDAKAMQRRDFWRVDVPPVLLSNPYALACGHCGGDGVVARAGLPVCRMCLVKLMASAVGLQTEARDG